MDSNANSSPCVLITGASAGIGAAAAFVFAEAGYDLILTARRLDKLTGVAEAVKKRFAARKIVHVECDVSSDVSVRQLFERISQEKMGVHVLVCNAGYGVYGSIEEVSIGDFRQNMETNYLGVIRCVQGALPFLRRAAGGSRARWGAAIVMVSSIVGRRAMPKVGSYCATKFALEALSETLRVELHDERIAVSVVNPGFTKTEFVDAAKGTRPAEFIAKGMTPEQVGRVILKATKRPRRNRYLTLAGKTCVFVQWLAPWVLDRAFLNMWRRANAKK